MTLELTEEKVRQEVQDYLGKNHDFSCEILNDDYENLRFMNYAISALDHVENSDMEIEDEDGLNMWHHAQDEVERAFIIWLVKGRLTMEDILKLAEEEAEQAREEKNGTPGDRKRARETLKLAETLCQLRIDSGLAVPTWLMDIADESCNGEDRVDAMQTMLNDLRRSNQQNI